jgi:hypothetical protein
MSSINVSQIKQMTTQSSSISPNYKELKPIFKFKAICEQWVLEDLIVNIG